MLQHAVEFDRAQARHVSDGWNWSATFFLLPLITATLVTTIALNRVPTSMRHTGVLWGWSLGYPVGFSIWMGLWHTLGGASGRPAAAALVIAPAAWLLWPLGLAWLADASRRQQGTMVCAGVLIVLIVYALLMPHGTKLLWLVLVGVVAGSLPYLWVVRQRLTAQSNTGMAAAR